MLSNDNKLKVNYSHRREEEIGEKERETKEEKNRKENEISVVIRKKEKK